MLWGWVGAALFLAGALALMTRHVVPEVVAPGSEAAYERRRDREALLAVAALVAAGGIVGRWWNEAPGFATALLLVLPLLLALTLVDLDEHRLPNRLTLACVVVTTCGLALATLATSSAGWLEARRALAGAALLGLFYLALALLGGGRGMGLGDVKLAPSLGGLLGWVGWETWAAGAFGAFLLGGLWGVVLMLRGRGRSARMPFGPFMIGGALAALCLA